MARIELPLGIVLAGGEGKRLMPLTADRAKPAVPFGGAYRLIDFVLSNLVNAGFLRIAVLTQYKSHSLDRHITTTWRMSNLLGNYIAPVPAQQRLGPRWYTGSADAILQNFNLIQDEDPTYVTVFGADHVYRMDPMQMFQQHVESGAGVSAEFSDDQYTAAGAIVKSGDVLRDADVIASVQPLTPDHMKTLKKSAITISFLSPTTAVDSIEAAASAGVIGYSQNQTKYGILGYNNTYSFYGAGDGYFSGQILATNNITAYYSDRRLKRDIVEIKNSLDLIRQISGVYYKQNDVAKSECGDARSTY